MNSAEYRALRAELDTLIAMQAGHTALLMAIMQTHPHHDQLQLAVTTQLELLLGRAPASAMSDAMREKTREFVEQLQRLRKTEAGQQAAAAISTAARSAR